MNLFRFRLITGLAAIALLALICVQLYWVYQTYKLRQETLNNQAVECLQQVGEKIESYATCVPTFSKAYLKPGEQVMLVKKSPEGLIDTLGQYSLFTHTEDTQFYDFSKYGFSYPALAEITVNYKMQLGDTIYKESNYAGAPSFENVTLKNYREIVDDGRKITEVLAPEYLDSLIRSAFTAINIHEDFVYGIRRKGEESFEYISSGGNDGDLNKSIIQASILEGRYFRNPHEIVIHFPNYLKILLQSMWFVLATSALIIFSILFAFWYFTRTIHRQREISQMKTDFINNMTHEFNTPLATISLAGQSLNDPRTSKDPQSLSRLSRVISYESQRLFQHIDRILQMGAAESGGLNLTLSTVNIHKYLERLKERFREKVPHAVIRLDLNASNSHIEADKMHINNVLYNLVDNAIKYSRDEVRIDISTRDGENGSILIAIRDYGIGIRKEDHDRIFDKFTRINAGDVHDVKGFGLGLYYVQKAVTAHHGKIEVQAVNGKGACFIIKLPVIQLQDYEQDIAG